MVKRWIPGRAVFYSILLLMGMILVQHFWRANQIDDSRWKRFNAGVADVIQGMISGTRNMITIGVAVATAGIIVGAVSSAGPNNAMVGLVEANSAVVFGAGYWFSHHCQLPGGRFLNGWSIGGAW